MIPANYQIDYFGAETPKPLDSYTNRILLLDDSVRLTSMMARYILLTCSDYGRSCALYHLGPAAQPRLTYYESGSASGKRNNRNSLDFAVFVAATPRHALLWLEETRPVTLTLVTDVLLQGDTQIGMVGVVDRLCELEIPTQLIFISGDGQNQALVKPLLDQRRASFVVKGSQEWSFLPRRLAENASRSNYHIIRDYDYEQLARLAPPQIAASL